MRVKGRAKMRWFGDKIFNAGKMTLTRYCSTKFKMSSISAFIALDFVGWEHER